VCVRQVVICTKDDTLLEAARRMRDLHVGSVVVVEGEEGARRPIGIITDRDMVIGPVASGVGDLTALLVGELMAAPLVTARESESALEVLRRMRSHGLRRIPVVDEPGILQGLIAFDDLIELVSEELGDLVELIAREQRHEASHAH
jgi:CBS domain-containing protein